LVTQHQIDVTLLEDLGELDQVLERAAQAVELGDDQLVAGPVGGQQRLIEPGAPRELAGCLIDEDLFAAGCVECVVPTRADSVELLERQGPDARD
jgi:hypothetical protein